MLSLFNALRTERGRSGFGLGCAQAKRAARTMPIEGLDIAMGFGVCLCVFHFSSVGSVLKNGEDSN